jgi:hypothetical protein
MNETTSTPELPVEMQLAAAPAATKNVLSSKNFLRLADWCREHRALCEKETNPKLAAMAATELDFQVTMPNIVNMLKTLEIEKWKPEEEKPLEEQFVVLRGTMQQVLDTLALFSARMTRLEEREARPEPQTKTITVMRNSRPATREELEAAVNGDPLPADPIDRADRVDGGLVHPVLGAFTGMERPTE